MELQTMINDFQTIYTDSMVGDARLFFSPGRINLIGEHTDYNGGHVFPCAITLGTYGAVKKRNDRIVRVYSKNFPDAGIVEFSLGELEYKKEHGWANFPKGMIAYIEEAGWKLPVGIDLYVYGNIPNGAGLSSSASLEILIGVTVNELFGFNIGRIELVKLGKKVENEFIGVNSGIMDQFAIGMGQAGSAILLDCNTLKYEYAPINLEDYQIMVMNTNKRRELADSKYNERRSECEAALAKLQSKLSISSLGELSEDEFEQHKQLIGDKVLEKRAKHAVCENQRTLKAFKALQEGRLEDFGKLMNESHQSLKNDYEVTGKELDALVEAAWQQEGTLGARMTGAGFGGCAIAIVEKDKAASFIKEVGKKYMKRIGYAADFYAASVGDGTKEIILEVHG
ncbi:galactokinase [Bacillus sp. UMB0728]|uniref:galactokinase n=1 Tax=Bacillus sp. UMB0728 TaxID=2066052 RepID=UPI000C780DC0|nr:galactokinase [Bacillus sp. UMB0728]PLR70832.1 galactokinase [Bacillus sp. UMB0728]